MKADLLIQEFASEAVPYAGGLLLLEPGDALALISRAVEEGVPILGIDGMRATADGCESRIEHIADFSAAVAEGHGCWDDADAFVRAHRHQGLAFEVTLGDDPVEAV